MKPLAKRLRAVRPLPSGPKPTKRSHSYQAGLRDGQRAGEHEGRRKGREEMREEMTFELGVAEGETLIGALPEHMYVRVAVMPKLQRAFVGQAAIDRYAMYLDSSVKMLTFRAVKMAWSSGNDDRFCWFTWERAR